MQLWKTSPNELAACFVLCDGSDSCRVGFTPLEHAVGARGCSLDCAQIRLLEVYSPEHLTATVILCITAIAGM